MSSCHRLGMALAGHGRAMTADSARSLTRFSLATALVTIALKFAACFLTGSAGLLSDALESVVNLVAAIGALTALIVAAQPANEEHAQRTASKCAISQGLIRRRRPVFRAFIGQAWFPRVDHRCNYGA